MTKTDINEADIDGLEDVGAPEYREIYTTPDQLSDGLLTLSLIPRSRWQTLLNLDTIRVSLILPCRNNTD